MADEAIGVSSYDVKLETQEVFVTGTIPYDELLEKIKKTGKEVIILSFPSFDIQRLDSSRSFHPTFLLHPIPNPLGLITPCR